MTKTFYDLNDNVTKVETPRNGVSSDPQFGKVYSESEYNGRDLVSETTAAAGDSAIAATSEFTYDLNGRQITTLDPRGNLWQTDYLECCGQSTGQKDPLGHGTITNTDAMGRTVHWVTVKDYADHLSNELDPVDAKTLIETTQKFDILGRSTHQTRWLAALGQIDRQNPPIAGYNGISASSGLTSLTLYDDNLSDGIGLDSSSGVTVTLPSGASQTVSLTTMLTKLADTNADGGAGISFNSSSAGSAMVQIRPTGELSASISDGLGRTVMVAQLNPASSPNPLITWSCSSHDHTTTISGFGTVEESRSIDALGNVAKSLTDGAGRTLRTIDELGEISTTKYDTRSNVRETRDPNGVGYDALFDDLGRMTSQTDTFNDTTSMAYDREGNVISTTDAKSKTTTMAYDAMNRLVSTTDRLSGVTASAYDKNSNLTSLTDSESQTTTYAYSVRNERISETYPDHTAGTSSGDPGYGIVETAIDEAGRPLRRTDQKSDTITTVYDMASRVLSRDYRLKANSPSGTIADQDTFTYDSSSRMLTGVSGRYSNTVTNTFDNAGRLSTESLAIGGQTYTVTSEYDLRSQRKKATYPNSSTWERTYTARRQLYETKYNGSTVDTRVYDDGGRLDTSTYANGVAADYNWRADNLLADIGFSHPGGVAANRRIGTYTYAWDTNKNKTKETITGQIPGFSFDTTLGTDPDGYDDEDRLTYFKRQSTTNPQTWDLSLVGDWNSWSNFGTSQSRTHGPAHEILTAGNAPNNAFTHDVKGNMTDIPSNILSPARKQFWDFDNQLTGVDTTGDSTPEVTCEYDVLHRRVARIEGSDSKVYVHSGNQIIADYNRGNTPGTAPVFRYVWGDYIDEPILRQSAAGTVLYFHRNQQYSTVALTNTSGEVVERYGYTAYGQLTVMNYLGNKRSWTDWSNRFLYTGREWDDTTKLFHFRARWYEPVAGRFVSRDPIGYVDGMSLYRGYFVLEAVDFSGLRVIGVKDSFSIIFVDDLDEGDGLTIASGEQFLAKAKSWAKRFPGCVVKSTRIQDPGCNRPFQIHQSFGVEAGTSCADFAAIIDHGGTRRNQNQLVNDARLFPDSQSNMDLCRLLCDNATVFMLGCFAGQLNPNGTAVSFSAPQNLVNRCDKNITVYACEKCNTGYSLAHHDDLNCSSGSVEFSKGKMPRNTKMTNWIPLLTQVNPVGCSRKLKISPQFVD